MGEVSRQQMGEVFRLQLVERANGMVEARAIGYARATATLPFAPDELDGLLADGAYARVGQALYDVLLPPGEVRDALAEALVVSRAERRPLTVQLHLDAAAPALARYPWELVHDGSSFLVADGAIALARYVDDAQALAAATLQMPLRILVVAPRPIDLPSADEERTVSAITALEELRRRGLVQVDLLSPPTYAALRQVLSREPYQVLHFDGLSLCSDDFRLSGLCSNDSSRLSSPGDEPGFPEVVSEKPGLSTTSGALVFEDERAATSPVDAGALYNALFLSQVRLAVLTPTATAPAARPTALATLAPAIVRAGVPAVVALQHTLPAEAAERFVSQLYHSLASLAPLGTAVAHARGQLLPAASTRFSAAVYLQDAEGTGVVAAGKGAAKGVPLGHVPSAPGAVSAGYQPDPVFVDRSQAVMGALQALASTNPRLCIWGMGGVGKTAVAREVVRRGAWRFPAGIVWVGLQGGRSLAGVLAEIARFGGVKLSPVLEDARRQVTTLLTERIAAAGGEMLLVMDNFEDVVADPDLKSFLLELPAGVRALATSRCELPAESWQGLELHAMGAADIERILRFQVRAQRLNLPPADDALLTEISGLLDGYPLGVELVVSLARTCSWAHIRDELAHQPPPVLQAILRTTVNEGLDDEQRGLAERLSVLRGPFDEAAIARVGRTKQWLPTVQRLRELSLLSFDGQQYAFDVPGREYLYGLLEPEVAQDCHAEAYRYLAGRKDLDGLVEAYQHAMAAGRFDAARTLLRDKLLDALLDAGRFRELLGLLEAALSNPATFDERFLLARASALRSLGQLEEALASLARLLQTPDLTVPSRAQALHEKGRIYCDLDDEERGDYQQALDLYAEALAICEALTQGDMDRNRRRWLDGEMAALLQDIGIVYQYALAGAPDLAFARQLYATSAGFWQRLKDPLSRAISDKQRAEILRTGSAEDRTEAKRIYRQVMLAFKRRGLERLYGESLLQLGKIYQGERALKHALKRFQEYEEIQRRLGLEREEAFAWKQQGEIYQEAGYRGRSVRSAAEFYTRALTRLPAYTDRRSRRTVVATYLRRGEAYLELRQPEAAAADFQEALQRAVAMGMHNAEFDVRSLSQSDRQRLVWAYCALQHTAGRDEGEPGDEHLPAVQATWETLVSRPGSDDLRPSLRGRIDCQTALPLPAWAHHHARRER